MSSREYFLALALAAPVLAPPAAARSPCIDCHREVAEHAVEVWSLGERDREAVLCGVRGRGLTVAEYLGCDATCPGCGAAFNPGCSNHWHHYFEMAETGP